MHILIDGGAKASLDGIKRHLSNAELNIADAMAAVENGMKQAADALCAMAEMHIDAARREITNAEHTD